MSDDKFAQVLKLLLSNEVNATEVLVRIAQIDPGLVMNSIINLHQYSVGVINGLRLSDS